MRRGASVHVAWTAGANLARGITDSLGFPVASRDALLAVVLKPSSAEVYRLRDFENRFVLPSRPDFCNPLRI